MAGPAAVRPRTNQVVLVQLVTRKIAWVAMGATVALAAAACGSSSSSSSSSSSASASGSTSAAVPQISAADFTPDMAVMAQLKGLAGSGKGNIAVILPDTVSSARYTEFDAPLLTQAFTAAGLSAAQFSVQNAQGSDATQLSDAQTAISKGATVLIVDPLDSGVGAQIEKYASSHGVKVIDYDRLTLGGSRSFYVSFNNVTVGTLLGNGLVQCVKDWNVAKPNVLVMYGSPTDNNATLFGQGYDAVLNPLFSANTYTKVGTAAGTWDPPTALTEFQQQFTAHPTINALLSPNDENASPIISYLQKKGIKAKTFPVTGQDATLIGLQDILAGYQCGTVYKPIYLEAEATAALAVYLRAGVTPPSGLVNDTTPDKTGNTQVPSVLLTPKWVTASNMASTVVADKAVPASQICTAAYKAACTAAGISG